MASPVALVAPDEAVLVFGSLSSNVDDRCLQRSDIKPIQVIVDDEVIPAPYFQSWGELGISSMAMTVDHEAPMYLTTGADLIEIRLNDQPEMVSIDIPNLRDVHELSIVGDTLWLANTGFDEAVGFHIPSRQVARRIKLEQFRLRTAVTVRSVPSEQDAPKEIDRFHCNQLFSGIDRNLYALVHHVSGKQSITQFAQKILKRQGNGGVINLESGKGVQLGLHAPHTVRVIGDEYWLFDSGKMTINVYDSSWSLDRRISIAGWGRGGDISRDSTRYFSGISAKRRRYRDSSENETGNLLQILCVATGKCLGEIPIPGIEQINNVYTVSRSQAEALLKLR